ncbi:hypothetical protein BWQ96_00030 [Gracilariopsis chorda]|uniref:ASPIC/UnbV domain-containing protein n=1 Tax=Gracilariopsis chorda TaxID=448386 RepID=A0A2V3JBM8_9FLOR|nr:hypothetical protein BWQ96_00030 [Gracilariopsis chorda]|eukprot:PXF49870.1 hypothetical protein BWQ96_00030 [Gracilariopsis chorda]
MFTFRTVCFCLLCLLPFVPFTVAQIKPKFADVTHRVGLNPRKPRLKKYGGPTIADLDRDGHPDLIFCHHDAGYADLYFNNRDGTFSQSQWRVWRDTHGIIPGPISPYTRAMRFVMTVGGSFGRRPTTPIMFQVDPNTRQITDITALAGLDKQGGRGRTAFFVNISARKHIAFPDLIFLNAQPKPTRALDNFAYEARGNGRYKPRSINDLASDTNWYGALTDVDSDGVMEVVTYWKLRVWRMNKPYSFVEISDKVLPPGIDRNGVVAVAELDYDNDGDFDLYVARTKSGDLKWQRGNVFNDYLLENRNGRYVDVTRNARIPPATTSRGVTVGDFNNDGYIDILVTQYQAADIMLLNNADGTFRRVDGLIWRPKNVRGDNALAVDYDSDGRLDLVSSQGDQHQVKYGGHYRIFRNLLPLSWRTRFLAVRVGNAPNFSATPLHATVLVVAGKLRMLRRIGSPGSAVSRAYLETVHFGLGRRKKADRIFVKYASGFVLLKRNVFHGQTVVFGRL